MLIITIFSFKLIFVFGAMVRVYIDKLNRTSYLYNIIQYEHLCFIFIFFSFQEFICCFIKADLPEKVSPHGVVTRFFTRFFSFFHFISFLSTRKYNILCYVRTHILCWWLWRPVVFDCNIWKKNRIQSKFSGYHLMHIAVLFHFVSFFKEFYRMDRLDRPFFVGQCKKQQQKKKMKSYSYILTLSPRAQQSKYIFSFFLNENKWELKKRKKKNDS